MVRHLCAKMWELKIIKQPNRGSFPGGLTFLEQKIHSVMFTRWGVGVCSVLVQVCSRLVHLLPAHQTPNSPTVNTSSFGAKPARRRANAKRLSLERLKVAGAVLQAQQLLYVTTAVHNDLGLRERGRDRQRRCARVLSTSFLHIKPPTVQQSIQVHLARNQQGVERTRSASALSASKSLAPFCRRSSSCMSPRPPCTMTLGCVRGAKTEGDGYRPGSPPPLLPTTCARPRTTTRGTSAHRTQAAPCTIYSGSLVNDPVFGESSWVFFFSHHDAKTTT
jgi:hypothetical protein